MDTAESNSRIRTTCLIILATVAVGFAVRWLKDALIPFVVAVFLTIGLMPCVSFLMRRCRAPKIPAVLATLTIAVVVLGVLAVTISTSLAGVGTYADTAGARMQELLNWAADALPLESLNIDREQVLRPFSQISGKAVGNLVVGIGSALTSLLSDGVLVLIFLGFLMFAGPSQTKAGDQWDEIETNVRRYIITKVLISAATGICTTLILWVLNVDLAVLLGLLAFLLNFIPSIGSVLGVIVPLPIILMDKPLVFGKVLLALALLGGMQFVIGNVIEPRLMGKRFGLHPVVILLALVFWGTLWGVIGMFLAVPMTAVIKIILEKHERSRGVADLLSGDFRGEL
ncbi:MAG: AI-2E family transporter [Planctomycetota bacterium]|jgi:AI-2 transport protein TqsA